MAGLQDMEEFFRVSNSRFHGNAICDCFQPTFGAECENQLPVENRYYWKRPQDIRLHYIKWFGTRFPLRGHNTSWLNVQVTSRDGLNQAATNGRDSSEQHGCKPGLCSPLHGSPAPKDCQDIRWHWEGGIYHALETHVASLEPDILIFNSGHWMKLPGPWDMDTLIGSLKKSVEKKKGVVYFKTSTADSRSFKTIDDSLVAAKFRDAGFRTYDTQLFTYLIRESEGINTRSVYWDENHFHPKASFVIDVLGIYAYKYTPYICIYRCIHT